MADTLLPAGAAVAELGRVLTDRGWRCVTAESCTGGGVANALTAVAGSSAWFDRGYVTYSNAAKQQVLGVRDTTLAAHGAVSEATAREMAAGALRAAAAEAAVAVTGIAGPDGGSADKPVGTVAFAWALAGHAAESETRRFAGDRNAVRAQAVDHAISGLLARVRVHDSAQR